MRTLIATLPALTEGATADDAYIYAAYNRGGAGSISSIVPGARLRGVSLASEQHHVYQLPRGVAGEDHHDFEYDPQSHVLRIYAIDDTAERVASAPHSESLLNAINTVDSTDASLCESLRNKCYIATMQGLGPGRWNTEYHRQNAARVAAAVVDLYFRSTDRVDPDTALDEKHVERIDPANNYQSHRNAAVKALRNRAEDYQDLIPSRAVQLVQEAEGTGRTAPTEGE